MARKAEVIITCDASTVEKVLEGLNRELDKANQRREQLLNKQKQNQSLTKEEEKEFRDLTKYVGALNEKQQQYTTETRKMGEVMKDLAGAKSKDLKKALREGKQALDKMSERDPKRKALVDDLKRIQQQIDKNTGSIKAQGNAFATTAKNLATYMIGFAGFNKVKSLIEDVFKSNVKLSDSLANIRKVSGLSGEAINQLYRNISKIDSRNTIETLNELAYTGAKLGIGQNYGVEGLTGFVKAAEQVQMALGEDMGEKALPELSKMIEVMGLIPKFGVEQSMQKAASAIFQLGATSTATGSNIVEFSKRLMGLANVSRVSTQDLLGLASASDAMGLMPEVSATAFNKLFTSLQKNHNLIEKSLGLDDGTIRKLYDQGKTMDAMVLIFEKMNEKGNMNLLGSIFKDLGSDGARLVNVMATMADRADILRKHLEVSRNAFKEGEAVIGEYMIQNQTAAALLERSSNLWAKAFTNPEGVTMVKELAQAWYDVSKAMTQNEGMMESLRRSIESIATVIGLLITSLPVLLRLAMAFGTAFAFKQMIIGIGAARVAIGAFIKDIRLATGVMGTFNTIMKSNIFIFLASALYTVITLIHDFNNAAAEAAKREAERQAELKASFENSREAVEKCVKPLEVYKKALDDANLSEKQKLQLVKDFRNDYQDYLDYLGIEVNTAYDLANAYAAVVKVMKQKKAYEERESFRTQMNGDNRMSRIENQAKVEAAARSFGLTDVDKAYLEKNQSKGTNQLYRELIERKMGAKAFKQEGEDVTFIYIDDKLVNAGTQFGPRAKKRFKKVGSEELYDAIDAYIGAYRAEQSTNKQINQMFSSEYKDIDLDNFNIDEFNQKVQEARWKRGGSLENEAPDKKAIAEAKRQAQERKKELKQELDLAKRNSDAVISKVEEWYRLQETAITAQLADGILSEQESKRRIIELNTYKNQALEYVRSAITGRDTDSWNEFKENMGAMMMDMGEWSKDLLKEVQEVDIDAVRSAINRFNGSAEVLGISAASVRDAIDKNAAGNKRERARLEAEAVKMVKDLLEKYHYFDEARNKFYDDLMSIGAIGETAEEMAARMQEGGQRERREDILPMVEALGERFRSLGSKAFTINPENAKEIADLIAQMIQDHLDNPDEPTWTLQFPNIMDWQQDAELYKTELQNFYNVLLKMESDYYKARKSQYELYKKENEQRWEESGRKEYYDQAFASLGNMQQLQDVFGAGQSFGQQYGFANAIADDPEVKLYQEKLRAATEYFQFVQDHQHTEQELREAGQAALEAYLAMAQKVSSEVAERASKIQELQEPATTFAEEVGQKWGDMMFDMESSQQTWNAIVKKMILGFATMTIKMTAENLTKKLQQALFYKQMLAMETEHQTEMLGVQLAFGTLRLQAQQGIDTALQAQKSVNDATTVSKEASLATILTAMGISEGAAKTIGQLGWWGIPLIAVISSLLLGLLSSALSTAGAQSKSTAATKKVKLASGMLTYDEGNVQTVVGNDGRVYRAREQRSLPSGVSMVTEPIATTVNGQQALVGERGPEIVIGRKTTRAIQMNRPDLLRDLALIDRGITTRKIRTFDEGNIQDLASAIRPVDASTGSATEGDSNSPEMRQTLDSLSQTVAALSATVLQLQKNGIPAKIQKYGKGGLIDEVQSGLKFESKYK